MAETSGALPDLVHLQLRIAGGENLDSLGIQLSHLSVNGFGDRFAWVRGPAAGGMVTKHEEPPGVRMDSSVAEGTVALTDYDPMIAKASSRCGRRGRGRLGGALLQPGHEEQG